MTFRFEHCEIPDVILISTEMFEDHRGTFRESYRRSAFEAAGIHDSFVQDNVSTSQQGVIRGLHYQIHPQAQSKLVEVIRGEIFDVAVDIRKGSPYYGKWVGKHLSASESQLLYIPVGFAHGFQVLSAATEVSYKVSHEYAPELDRGIAWDDPELAIAWPISDPVLSPKDAELPSLAESNNNFIFAHQNS